MATVPVYGYAWDWENEKYITPKFRFDGEVYQVFPGTEHTTFNVEPGSYEIEMIIPGYTFDDWDNWEPELPGPSFSDIHANPTTIHISEDCYFYVYVYETPDPFETEYVETYRGVDIYQYVVSGWYQFTYDDVIYALPPPLSDVRAYIDDLIEAATEPQFIETYRGVDIYWLPTVELYRAFIEGWGTAVAPTLAELYPYIDEALAWLEQPDPDPGGILEQLLVKVQIWINTNLAGWLKPLGDLIDAGLAGAKLAWEGLYKNALRLIYIVDGALLNLAKTVGDRWDEFTTLTLPSIWDTITTKVGEVGDALDQAKVNLTESINQGLADNRAWVVAFFKLMDPIGFLKDPLGTVKAAWFFWAAAAETTMIKSFWEGFEEGLASG